MFKITVVEMKQRDLADDTLQQTDAIVRFEQTVDTLNLHAVIAAINRVPRKSRAKAKEQK